jgi:Undecaprenyl-phosphate glucose phosphotransferase
MSNVDHRVSFETASAATATAGIADREHKKTKLRRIDSGEHEINTRLLPGLSIEGSAPLYSPIVLAGVVQMIEAAALALLGYACWVGVGRPADIVRYLATSVGIISFTLVAFRCTGLYQLQVLRRQEQGYLPLTLAWSMLFVIATALLHFGRFDNDALRFWLASWYFSGLIIIAIFRGTTAELVRRWTKEGRFERRAVIIGADDRGDALIGRLLEQHDSDVRVIGVFDDRNEDRTGKTCHGIPRLGRVGDLLEFARHQRIDLVIVALPVAAEKRISEMLKKLWVLPLDIRLAAQGSKLRFQPKLYSYIGKVPLFDVIDRPIAHWDVVAKWLFDKIVGSIALICLAPLMTLVALAIKLDSKGPVLFRQARYGFNNQIVDVYKFRSMYVEQADATANKLVTRNDPRVTRIGRFIRRTSLDELPQLFNVVFSGNLSLVGPRPHAIHAKAEDQLYADAVDGYFGRHRVKPGITGWAQINGYRGETDRREKIEKRVDYDLYYIENWSILFDLWILIRTPFALIRGGSAY